MNSNRAFRRGAYFVCFALFLAAASTSLVSQDSERKAAFSLEQQGKYAAAEAIWQALARQYPKEAEPLAHIGLLEARQEHYTAAIAAYRKAWALAPEMPGLRLNLGLALFKAGDYKEAIETLQPLLKAAPSGSPDALRLEILLGMSHYGLKEFAAAVPYLQQAAAQDNQNLNLLLALAHSCLLSKQFPCVLDTFHRLVALNADSAEAHMLVGEALDEMKDTQGAVREFQAAIAVGPKEPNVHFGLGYLLWMQGKDQEAAEQFQEELENDPQHLPAMLYLADARIQMNQMDAARPLLEKLVKLDPSNAKAHLDLGIVDVEQDRKEEALKELQTAIQLAPDDVSAHWRLGRLYRSMGKNEEAKVEMEKANRLNKAADDRLLKIMSRIPAKDQAAPGAGGSEAGK
jgi:tetratricopeptide (TPR) repeat protein